MSSLIPQNDVSQPINIILDGPNYPYWAQALRSFLKGRKLWPFVSGDRTKPLQRKGGPASTPEFGSESDEDFANCLEDWDSINHRIITWFSNTSIASINMQFGHFDTAKEAWDTLAQRYTSTDLANQYQILSKLHDLHQDSKQSINDFHSHMSYLWDQLALSEPKWEYNKDADQFIIHRDNMLSEPKWEYNKDADQYIIHQIALAELISEETRFMTLKSHRSNMLTATTSQHPDMLTATTSQHPDMHSAVSSQHPDKQTATFSQVSIGSDGYHLSQSKYASEILSRAGLTDSKIESSPLEANVKLRSSDGEPLRNATLYRQLVGSLIYLTVTRPDIAYTVHLVN
ncbi:hypothetical protein RJ639_002820 [Escallonia herrerae]|uniref:Retrotransposon Copia-like N-terminal domain-containing protein n=1 Tax=Escallonia herrerae TaxID=1293975 RepID=A0AA89AWY8_9ASTE|nr:hypothetical protein RJ639_002820 [Escallonia herrerae]